MDQFNAWGSVSDLQACLRFQCSKKVKKHWLREQKKRCPEQLSQSHFLAVYQLGVKLMTSWSWIRCHPFVPMYKLTQLNNSHNLNLMLQ